MKKHFKSGIIFSLLCLFLFIPQVAYQQAPFVNCQSTACTINDLLAVPVRIFNYLLSVAAIVLLAVIIWAGARMALYSFSESPESELEAAKLTLSRGIFGFFIIACSYLIVNILAITILGLQKTSAVGKLLQQFGLI